MYYLHLIAFKFANNFWTNYFPPASPGSYKGLEEAIKERERGPNVNIYVLVCLLFSFSSWCHWCKKKKKILATSLFCLMCILLHFKLVLWHSGVSSGYFASRLTWWLFNTVVAAAINTCFSVHPFFVPSLTHTFIHSLTSFPPTHECRQLCRVKRGYNGSSQIVGSRCSHHASPHTSWPPVRSSGPAAALCFQPDNTEWGWPSCEALALHRWAAVTSTAWSWTWALAGKLNWRKMAEKHA